MSINTINNSLLQKLQAFGLTEGEASVYLTLLEHGRELGGTKLALITGMHRQYIYIALPKLLTLGLVEEVGDGKHKKYKARPPQEIEKIARKRALEAGDLARELNTISNIGNEQEFEVIQGFKAIQEYELQYALRAETGSEECILGGASTAFADVMGDALPEYLEIKTEKNMRVRYLGTENERADYAQYIGKYPNQEYRFMRQLPKGKTHMLVRKDSVSFYTFLNPPLVYVVKSPIIAQNYKNFFMMLWEMGEG
jgi:sugar-specific transcriptional regulator TrmB